MMGYVQDEIASKQEEFPQNLTSQLQLNRGNRQPSAFVVCRVEALNGLKLEQKMSEEALPEAEVKRLPQKKHFRQRAHANPISDHDIEHPASPDAVDWSVHYPTIRACSSSDNQKRVEWADVGCGYGGLLVSLATRYPDTLMLGLEIRIKVWDYVRERIEALRTQHPGQYGNVFVLRTNAMKYLPNYFRKHQLSKMFFLYPDPHFKKAKHKWRIITPMLLAEYAYCLRPGGILYTITDVKDVHDWIVLHTSAHPLFRRFTKEEEDADPIVPFLYESTEEGQKVTRNEGDKFLAVFHRIP